MSTITKAPRVGATVNVRRKNGAEIRLKIVNIDTSGKRGAWYYGTEVGVKTAKGVTQKHYGFQLKQIIG